MVGEFATPSFAAFEMLFEGIILWAIIGFFCKRKPFKSFLIGLYFFSYGIFRFSSNISASRTKNSATALNWLNQPCSCLCPLQFLYRADSLFFMIVFGIVWIIICSRLPGRKPWMYNEDSQAARLRRTRRMNAIGGAKAQWGRQCTGIRH